MTNSSYTSSNSVAYEYFRSGGFLELTNLPTGRYVQLYKAGLHEAADAIHYSFTEVKIYQTPNLVKVYQLDILFTDDTTEGKPSYEATNLIQNLENRVCNDNKAIQNETNMSASET